MKILVTGAAGFIGFHLVRTLLDEGHQVVGLDNINDYYDVNLKYARLAACGISKDHLDDDSLMPSEMYSNYRFQKTDIAAMENLELLFRREQFDTVLHMAAQVGVRYSLENPQAYTHSNLIGFINILECCRHHGVKHLIYASSSSIYGLNNKIPFNEDDRVDQPVSLYAATKRSNELAAYSYSHLYGLKTTGLRFFTVYGPWGRPDMAMFLFVDAILNGRPLNVFNNGNLSRDFTYVDDIVDGIKRVLYGSEGTTEVTNYTIYNIGNSKSVKLLDFIEAIEKHTGKKATKKLLPMQPGDVEATWADVSKLQKDFGYKPQTSVDTGVKRFVEWYLRYIG
ncbi:NAD-dependent epimerase [Parapedobacter koreensis]|nr:NAD-dependent epimerase [Parapedobacter koreensis]